MRNKKGFTLVELLAVIVILAVVMLIGVTAVGPVMEKARKNAIIDEGAVIVDAVMITYNSQAAFGDTSIFTWTPVTGSTNSTACVDLATLEGAGYYTKKNGDIVGKVDVTKDANDNITVKYSIINKSTKYGITNGTASSTINDVASSVDITTPPAC